MQTSLFKSLSFEQVTASSGDVTTATNISTISILISVVTALLLILITIKLIPKSTNQDKDRSYERFPDIPGPTFGDDIYKLVQDTRHHGMVEAHEKYGELFQFPTRRGPIVFVRGADELLKVFTGKDFVKNQSTWGVVEGAIDVSNLVQPMMTDTLFDWEGERWQMSRKVINPFFANPEIIPITLKYVQSHMSKWGKEYEVDFLVECHDIVKYAVIQLMCGMKLTEEENKTLSEVMNYFLKINTVPEAPIFGVKDARMIQKMIPFCNKAIEWNKRPENANDKNQKYGLIAPMLKAGRQELEIRNLLINLIVAGGETPALVCCKTLAAITANPEVLQRAIQEVDSFDQITADNVDNLSYIESCLQEGLRRYAPATVVGRVVKKDTKLLGYNISEGSSLHVNVHAVHMDAKVWPNPQKYDPLRFELDEDGEFLNDVHPNGLVAFGLGTRVCPGKRAYMKMSKTIIGTILKKYTPSTQYKGNETNGVDLDSFLPNRFVAWDTNGMKFKFTQR